METPKSLNNKNESFIDLIVVNWSNLDQAQKEPLIKIWKVLTYKWQLQILFNLPFLVWWVLDYTFIKVHEFDMKLISYLNLPDWAMSMMGLS